MNLAFIYVAYAVFLIGYVLFSWAGFYHLWRFGYKGDLSKMVIFVYIILSIVIIALTIFLLINR